ncbi:uncharacterized protein [Aristolochia californica]|uniref:uncharacterized protein isoform X2 n=1 Tax=Aristolochia californica TaxID=171875 RepID=UPI0035E3115E
MEDAVAKRLGIQNELLRRLEDFSQHLQKRANAATEEVHRLVDQTGVVEQHLKNTFNSFRCLSHHRFVQNKISEEDGLMFHIEEDGRNSEAAIPAQSYEKDILPRYREALSLGLSSYQNHVQSKNRTSLGSVFRIGSRYGPLPHIIGSDEYIHDNSCGLVTEDSIPSETSHLDFILAGEQYDVRPSAGEGGSHPTVAADLYGMGNPPNKKGEVESLVSAASDFKAMLEAALLSSYKFYDEDSTAPPDLISHNTRNLHAELEHATFSESNTATDAMSVSRASIGDTNLPVAAGNLNSLQDSDVNLNKPRSTLVSECHLEDSEESLPSQLNHPVYTSTAVSSTRDPEKIASDTEPSGSISAMSVQDDKVIKPCNKEIMQAPSEVGSISAMSVQDDEVIPPCNKEIMQAPSEVVSALEKCVDGDHDSHSPSLGSSRADQFTHTDEASSSKTDA